MMSPGKREHSFGPLMFPNVSSKPCYTTFAFGENACVNCILCELTFEFPHQKKQYLLHLYEIHNIVIADEDKIACLKSYVDYWRVRFREKPLNYFCSTLLCNSAEGGGTKKEYYLLSDIVPEDKLLREGLQRKRLEWILDIQSKERETPIFRSCVFCRLQFEGPRSEFFSHLQEKHHLHLGCPDNLVFTDELLDIIETMMETLQCIYCEGYFKERNILKEHMRKKQHKRINPSNTSYDRFYVVNYLEIGKTWQQMEKEHDEADLADERSDWSDWEDDVEPQIVCLFCDERNFNFENILEHMNKAHSFHFQEICNDHELNFYHQVKLTNYIRLQMYNMRCSFCMEQFSSKKEVLEHMTENKHFKFPEMKLWNQPEFYFSTYENDSFLCHLEDSAPDDVNSVITSGQVN